MQCIQCGLERKWFLRTGYLSSFFIQSNWFVIVEQLPTNNVRPKHLLDRSFKSFKSKFTGFSFRRIKDRRFFFAGSSLAGFLFAGPSLAGFLRGIKPLRFFPTSSLTNSLQSGAQGDCSQRIHFATLRVQYTLRHPEWITVYHSVSHYTQGVLYHNTPRVQYTLIHPERITIQLECITVYHTTPRVCITADTLCQRSQNCTWLPIALLLEYNPKYKHKYNICSERMHCIAP